MKQLLVLLFTFRSLSLLAQHEVLSADLQPHWRVHTDSGYVAYDGIEPVMAIHFLVHANTGHGDFLKIHAKEAVSVFLNQQLVIAEREALVLSIDSLRREFAQDDFMISIYGREMAKNTLQTTLVHYALVEGKSIHEKRPPMYAIDFVLIAAGIILTLLIVIIKLNPKLASDYFSVTKIFSLRESEDSIVYTRITSSSNFLFYGFSSLTIGFFLMILFINLPGKWLMRPATLSDLMQDWLLLSTLVIVVFSIKMLIIYLFASLFQLRDVAGMQFFNWARLFFLFVGFSTALLSVSMLTRVMAEPWFNFFYVSSGVLLILWIVLAFFKIASKARLSLFHLFSYLCATEIIPSLIVLKILYY